MIRERNVYKDELPVKVLVAEMESYPFHFHEDLEILYVLEGKVELRCGAYTYHLRASDAFIINSNELHYLKADSKNNMLMILHISSSYFNEYYKDLKGSFFMMDPEKDLPKEVDIAKRLIGKIMLEIIQKGYGYEEKVIETTHNLISVLLSDFRYEIIGDGKLLGVSSKSDRILAARLCKIMSLMCERYNSKLTLNSIAEAENLSIYYLSHVIKDAAGLSFQELLNYIRVEESKALLQNTDRKISVVAAETGFSAVRYYIKHFEDRYGVTPAEYRKKYGEAGKPDVQEARYVKSDSDDIEEALKKQHIELYREYLNIRKLLPVIVEVDLSKEFSPEGKPYFAGRLMDRGDVTRPLARPYKLLKSLREHVRERGVNFIVTADTETGECEKCMSVLVYNLNDTMCSDFLAAQSKEKMLERIDTYNEGAEFLIRITELHGNFRISRYKLSQENIRCAYEEAINQSSKNISTGKRQAIVSNWSTLPDTRFDNVTTMGNLSLRSTLKGVSGELILIDRVE
ncbi:MAG: AraC family transcriptional regulator [Eubacteriales bacterium]|nr:AraC family transcriptional regulator [Eubacteriales bacterium]MDD4390289.1 AraC family transcriptional regulator [Eubacteriales bacterium]